MNIVNKKITEKERKDQKKKKKKSSSSLSLPSFPNSNGFISQLKSC